MELLLKLQSIDMAIGALVRAWMVAQKWYLTEDRMIPEEEWKAQKLNDGLIEVGLAQKVNDKIRMCGADEQFSWLVQCSQAGKNSVASRKRNKAKIERPLTPVEPPLTNPQPSLKGREPLPLSLTLSLNTNTKTKDETSVSPQVSDSNSLVEKSNEAVPKTAENKKTPALIAAMVVAWQSKFPDTRPYLGGKELGILKRLSRDLSVEHFSELYQVYLQMRTPWFEEKKWDLATFEQNLQKINMARQSGTDDSGSLSHIDWSAIEKGSARQEVV